MARITEVTFKKQKGPAFELEVTTRGALRVKGLEIDLGKPSRPDFYLIFHITKGRGTHTVDIKHYEVGPSSTMFTSSVCCSTVTPLRIRPSSVDDNRPCS